MRKIIFLNDFATKKKGEFWVCDSMLASQLVTDGEAKYFEEEVKEVRKTKVK
jgi:hypothetical protein